MGQPQTATPREFCSMVLRQLSGDRRRVRYFAEPVSTFSRDHYPQLAEPEWRQQVLTILTCFSCEFEVTPPSRWLGQGPMCWDLRVTWTGAAAHHQSRRAG